MAVREAREGSFWRQMARALRSRNYRLFFAGQSISLVGTWIQQVALSWLVYRLTGSAFLLGLVGFASQVPIFLLAPIAGVMADRWNRHRMLIVTQSLSMVQAGILAALVFPGWITVWQILALSAFLGVINAFDTPARQAFVLDMIEDRADLSNAIALNSSMVNGARLVGPSVAGLLLATVGEAWCFLLNSLSYVAVIAGLLAMRLAAAPPRPRPARVWTELREGLAYGGGFPPIRAILILIALVSLVAMPYTVLMPVFATRILHGGPSTLGFLMGATGTGALAGALYLAARPSILGLGKVTVGGAGLFGAGLIVFGLSGKLWLSLLMLMVSGFGMMVQMAASNTILQTIADEDKRGRVMSLYTLAFLGIAPFGSLLAGGLANRIGAPLTMIIGGVCCLLAAPLFGRQLPALREQVRPIYRRLGIIPEVATGVQTATELTNPNKRL